MREHFSIACNTSFRARGPIAKNVPWLRSYIHWMRAVDQRFQNIIVRSEIFFHEFINSINKPILFPKISLQHQPGPWWFQTVTVPAHWALTVINDFHKASMNILPIQITITVLKHFIDFPKMIYLSVSGTLLSSGIIAATRLNLKTYSGIKIRVSHKPSGY